MSDLVDAGRMFRRICQYPHPDLIMIKDAGPGFRPVPVSGPSAIETRHLELVLSFILSSMALCAGHARHIEHIQD